MVQAPPEGGPGSRTSIRVERSKGATTDSPFSSTPATSPDTATGPDGRSGETAVSGKVLLALARDDDRGRAEAFLEGGLIQELFCKQLPRSAIAHPIVEAGENHIEPLRLLDAKVDSYREPREAIPMKVLGVRGRRLDEVGNEHRGIVPAADERQE